MTFTDNSPISQRSSSHPSAYKYPSIYILSLYQQSYLFIFISLHRHIIYSLYSLFFSLYHTQNISYNKDLYQLHKCPIVLQQIHPLFHTNPIHNWEFFIFPNEDTFAQRSISIPPILHASSHYPSLPSSSSFILSRSSIVLSNTSIVINNNAIAKFQSVLAHPLFHHHMITMS